MCLDDRHDGCALKKACALRAAVDKPGSQTSHIHFLSHWALQTLRLEIASMMTQQQLCSCPDSQLGPFFGFSEARSDAQHCETRDSKASKRSPYSS